MEVHMSNRAAALNESKRPANSEAGLRGLLPALRRLDALLAQLFAAVQSRGGMGMAALQGLYVSSEEVGQLLARDACAPGFGGGGRSLVEPSPELAHLVRLQHRFDLDAFDLDMILIALAPELDLRYERLYGFLQDDVTRRRATVDLALNLRTSSVEEKATRLAHFAPDAALIRHAVLHLVPDPAHVQPPLLANYLKLDQQIIDAVLGRGGLDFRLSSFCRLVDARPGLDRLPLKPEIARALRTLGRRAHDLCQPLTLFFHGAQDAGQSAAAEALAGELGLNLLHANLTKAGDPADDFDATLSLLLREAWLKDAILYVDGVDGPRREQWIRSYRRLPEAGIVILTGAQAWTPGDADVVSVAWGALDFEMRRTCWQANLSNVELSLSRPDLGALAGRFRLTSGQIAKAVANARNQAVWRAATRGRPHPGGPDPGPKLDLADLFAGARVQSGSELGTLTRKVTPRHAWEELILPADQAAQLREICDQAKLRHVVYGGWGFDRKLSTGKGLNVLFTGPPGTGKTMAADVIAGELQLDLYQIDLSQVVSKYIGETEKNLERIFAAAENANAILFFDEADALFGKRSEVKDAHDRFANIEIGYLLQKMEQHEGVVILATNLRQNFDEAFLRRLHSIVEFPFPDEHFRGRIWQAVFPSEAPLSEDLDVSFLAREVRMAGGGIKNIALTAAFYAAADGRAIAMEHIVRAARREHRKVGRAWDVSRPPALPTQCDSLAHADENDCDLGATGS
jgi:AAA+ superfamily predicted ATPase